MTLQDRLYHRTKAAERALAANDASIPADYRRMLRIVDGHTHADVVRGCMRDIPDSLLGDWLAELEEMGFLMSKEGDVSQDLDFSGAVESSRGRSAAAGPEELQHVAGQARTAGKTLQRKGAFLSPTRLLNREPLGKSPEQTTVLVLEDDPDQAALAELRLNLAGYQLRMASGVKEMLAHLGARPTPDVALLDVRLPDGDGFDILAAIRRHAKLALLPVIMLTALVSESDVIRGLALGADGYITKPYSKNIVVETIKEVLKQS